MAGTGCFFNFFYDLLRKGENKSYGPQWAGFYNDISIFNSLSESLTVLSQNAESKATALDDTKTKFNAALEDEDQKGDLEEVKENINNTLNDFASTLTFLIEYEQALKEGINPMDEASEQIGLLNDQVQILLRKLLLNIPDYYKYIHKDFRKTYIISISLFLILSLTEVFLVIFSKLFSDCSFRFLFHLFWNFLILFTIIGFAIASCFGILGFILKDFAGVSDLVLGTDNLLNKEKPPTLIDIPEITPLINECMNGEGRMIKAFPFFNETIEDLNSLYRRETDINIIIDYLSENENCTISGRYCYDILEYMKQLKWTNDFLKGDYEIYMGNEDIFGFLNCSKYFINFP
ncbi:MAG: hypothetical protein MJ252_22015 [archaeon]|nr:hypothetical protein [archaeon]